MDGTITATIRFDPEQFHLLHDICDNPRPDRTFLSIHPDTHFTGYEFRIQRSRYRALSRAMLPTVATANRPIVQALMGMPSATYLSINQINAHAPKVQSNHLLNMERSSVIKALLASVPILYQQAPAGTGKT